MLIFNNLLLNKNSDKFQPFFIDLISGKRRNLNNYEFIIIKYMGNDVFKFSREERCLYNKLIDEEQSITDKNRIKNGKTFDR